MTGLNDMVRRIPRALYAMAVLTFVWKLANTFVELSIMHGSSVGFDASMDSMTTLTKSKTLLWAIQDAMYFVAYAAIVQVQIAIYDRIGQK